MECSSESSRLLTAGGILSIVGGVLGIIGGGIGIDMIMQNTALGPLVPILPVSSLPGTEIWIVYVQNGFVNVAMLVMALGVIAIVGGISVLRRKSFGLSLAGAVCALPSTVPGILAVVFMALGRRKFNAVRKEDGI